MNNHVKCAGRNNCYMTMLYFDVHTSVVNVHSNAYFNLDQYVEYCFTSMNSTVLQAMLLQLTMAVVKGTFELILVPLNNTQ